MAIAYKIQPKKNPTTKVVKYYAQKAISPFVDIEQVAARIEKESTVSEADIKAVLSALQGIVIDELQRGNSVRLGDLGLFHTTITSIGEDEAKNVTADSIRRVKVQFSKSSRMNKAMQRSSLQFARVGEDKQQPSGE